MQEVITVKNVLSNEALYYSWKQATVYPKRAGVLRCVYETLTRNYQILYKGWQQAQLRIFNVRELHYSHKFIINKAHSMICVNHY